MDYTIYVPLGGAALATVAAASALVGQEYPDGRVDCHYEGGLYGGEAMTRFHARLRTAASRRCERYPTSARAWFPAGEVRAVGTYDSVRHAVTAISDPALLETWSGEDADCIMGARHPAGPMAWSDAAALVEGCQLVGPAAGRLRLCFRTKAGQLVRFDAVRRTAEVFDHGDPRLPVDAGDRQAD